MARLRRLSNFLFFFFGNDRYMYFNGPYDSDLSVAIYEHDQIYLKEIREKIPIVCKYAFDE